MRGAEPIAPGPGAVDEYLARVPEPARTTLMKLRATIRSVVPPGTTEEITYGMPTFKYLGGLVAFGAFKRHCSLFPMSGKAIDGCEEEWKPYRTSKGTLQFPLDQAPPAALVKKLVKARVAENEARKKR